MRIGFIGLGNMGGPMSARLAAAGHDVLGYDLVAPPPCGVGSARDLAEVARDAEAIVTMLPSGNVLLNVYERILPLVRDAVLIDCSTVDVDHAREAAKLARLRDLRALDAPVSGGTAGAAAGTLTFMVGGNADALETARPLLEAMGNRIVHCGGPGSGQAAKVCNNMVLGVTMAAVSEAFVLAEGLGLDAKALFDVMSCSSGSCWALTSYCPVPGVGPETPADRGYAAGFAAVLMSKDLDLAEVAAVGAGAATPLGRAAAVLYREMVAEGGGGRDFSAVLPFLANRMRGAA